MTNCNHSNQTFIREQEFSCEVGTFNLEVSHCNECGEYLYGYDGWQRNDWKSLGDVKAYLKSL